MRRFRNTTSNFRQGGTSSRMVLAGGPTAFVGSIALALSALPASAATVDAETRAADGMLRGIRTTGADTAVGVPRTAAGTANAPRTPMTSAARPAAEAPPAAYTVQRGDTVGRIATRFGLRTDDVLALNGLGWSSTIYPGQVLTLTAATAPVPTPTAPSSGSHTVAAGDTISAIASRYGVTTGAVLSANGLGWSSIIYPGQTITIPGAAVPAASAPAPAPAPAPSPAPTAGDVHTVAAGDTISAIASRYGVTTDAVLAANGLSRSSIIYPGQPIAIPGAAPAIPGLSAEQISNARLIVRIGREIGVSDRGIAIALGTAMQESSLRNLTWGDRDSLGLFQQRPSYGWGTAAEVQDAARATRVFFGGASDPNGARTRGLLDIPGWEGMSYAQAAQAVQISAYPDAYTQWEAPAYSWLASLG